MDPVSMTPLQMPSDSSPQQQKDATVDGVVFHQKKHAVTYASVRKYVLPPALQYSSAPSLEVAFRSASLSYLPVFLDNILSVLQFCSCVFGDSALEVDSFKHKVMLQHLLPSTVHMCAPNC